jgi:hypothetical protein
MEKLGDTQKRNSSQDRDVTKRGKSSGTGGDSLEYLRDRKSTKRKSWR